MTKDEKIEIAAAAAHMANRAVCIAIGDASQAPWEDAPEWQRESARRGVEVALSGCTPEEQHDAWSREKLAAGWVYGPVKDTDAKTHPCLVPYTELPREQQVKDMVYGATVRSMAALLGLGGGAR